MMKIVTATVQAGVLALGVSFLGANTASAQSAVYKNCNTTPCTIGVAGLGYAPVGSPNYAAGWRRASQTYRDNANALRTLCRWHNWAGNFSPDVANGVVNCAALCGGNPSCQ